jgi:hypothetical protein
VRVLVYTATDFNEESHKCIDLLVANMTLPDNVDFCVMSNKPGPEGFSHKVIVDPKDYLYGGFLKYSALIPKGYDYYLFLDPDIIYFGNPMDLIDPTKDFTIVTEERHDMSREWFEYKRAPNLDRLKFTMLKGINAGTFGFKDLGFTAKVRSLFEPYIQTILPDDAILEQSSYNYGICLSTNFEMSKCNDIAQKVQLFAGYNPIDPMKQLFHFCGFKKSMVDKYSEMASLVKARVEGLTSN